MKKELKSRIYNYFVLRHKAFKYRRGWLRLPICPFCGREEKCGVNLSKDQVNCFVCGGHGSTLSSIRELEGLSSTTDVITYLRGGDFERFPYSDPLFDLREEIPVILPKGYKNIRRGDSGLAKLARTYLLNRGFSLEELGRKGIGYIDKPNELLTGYIIIPFKKDGKVIYYQTRRYMGKGPKYNNPTIEDLGIGKGQLVYNEEALRKYSEISIFEGVFNALTLGDSAIAILGKVLSSRQRSLIFKSSLNIINICLDDDAINYALKIARDLIIYYKIRIVEFPKGKDANDLGREKTQELINSTKLLVTYREVLVESQKILNRYGRKIAN